MPDEFSRNARIEALEASRNFAKDRSRHNAFGSFATAASSWLGSKWAFLGAILIILLWACSGALFHFSDTWQLVINTGTTIVTFLMVFLIQNTQNRDAKAINLKLDELIFATDAARDQMLDIERLSDEELNTLQRRYEQIRAECVRREGKSLGAASRRENDGKDQRASSTHKDQGKR